jgi:hypothetical protein
MATKGAGSGAQSARRRGLAKHESFFRYANDRWAKIAGGVALLAILVYAIDDPAPAPNGGSAYGYILGTIGALLILWLTLLGMRKRWIVPGNWSLKAWTSAHVFLGMALLVIGTLHTGFQFEWNVHTLAYVLMVIVIVSGMVGVLLYLLLPRALSDNRGEMTETQMVAALADIDRQLHDAAQPLERRRAERVDLALSEDVFAPGFARRVLGSFPPGATLDAREAFRAEGRTAFMHSDAKIEALLGRRLSVMALMQRHMHLKALLEGWLYLHVPVTFALIAALTAHVVAVFFYW